MDQENRLDVEQIIELLEIHDFKKLKEELETLHPVDIVECLEELDKKQRTLVFRLLAKEEAAEVFTDMNSEMREDLINALTDSELEEVMEEMYLDGFLKIAKLEGADIAPVLEQLNHISEQFHVKMVLSISMSRDALPESAKSQVI